METKGGGGLDEHVADQIAALEESIARVDEVFGNLSAVDYHDITKTMTSLEKAKYDLTNMYAINSLFWMYLRSFGEDPKNTSMKEELERIKMQMLRLSQIANKSKMPRIDKEAANRFVRHGLSKSVNKAGQKKPSSSDAGDEDWDDEPMETDAKNKSTEPNNSNNSSSRKRKRENEESKETSSEEGETSSSSSDSSDNDKSDS